jgi:hypothetical protein
MQPAGAKVRELRKSRVRNAKTKKYEKSKLHVLSMKTIVKIRKRHSDICLS